MFTSDAVVPPCVLAWALFAFLFRQYELVIWQRTAETGDRMQHAARCQPRLKNTQRVDNSCRRCKAGLLLRFCCGSVRLPAVFLPFNCKSLFLKNLASGSTRLYFERRTSKNSCLCRPQCSLAGSSLVEQSRFQSQRHSPLRRHSYTPSHQAH